MVGFFFYALDRALRAAWTWFPRHTLTFANKGDAVAHVRFRRNPLVRLLGLSQVGQYYFVNFPEISYTEWHPFSVSSGPREDSIELHIRNLGDHTGEVVALSKKLAPSKRPTWIRIDGPYGKQDFNFRRYPVVFLCGGGVGITPVMGMMKVRRESERVRERKEVEGEKRRRRVEKERMSPFSQWKNNARRL